MTIRSSETIRGALSFNFSSYKKVVPSHIKQIDISFLQWFIGFVEGDGSFIVSKKNKNNKQLMFIINQKDPKLMFKIKKKLGFGNVTNYEQDGQIYYRYSVSSLKNITRLMHLFNGNLILEKVNTRFQTWISQYNEQDFRSPITLLNQSPCLDLNSGWLSGFIDADGGFYARLKIDSMRLTWRLNMKFYITQKQEYKVLQVIKFLFSTDHQPLIINSSDVTKNIYNMKKDYYRLELTNAKHILNVINYLNIYPLQGNKNIIFKRWERIYGNKIILKSIKTNFHTKSFKRFKRLVDNLNLKS
uniref:Putative LAGLIDADG homing endonuclease n=1 Tax=Capsosiphon fulvescens TaxID=205396 RepID=A0A3P8MUM4_9CHLO|nr:putative LAGLIDADG homing endonuclease [Capsosiphon fulvescens]AWX64089.1 putative LAGLIDADG homing endonuclease [Capsosiphon fulvescens]